LCYGEETFFHEDILKKLRESYGGQGGWGYEVVDAASLDPARLVASAGTLSFGGGTKLTVIRSANKLSNTQLEELSKITGRSVRERAVVLLAEKNLKTTDKLLKWAGENKVNICRFSAPKPRELGRWVAEHAGSKGFTLDATTIAFIVDLSAGNLMGIIKMLDKIDLFRGDSTRVNKTDVADLLHDSFEKSVYDCVKAFFASRGEQGIKEEQRRYRQKATAEFHRVLRFNKNDGIIKFLRALSREAFTLLKYHHLAGKISGDALAKELKLGARKWLLKDEYPARARAWPRERLHRLLRRLAEVDLAIRTTGRDAEAMLEQIVIGNLAPTSVEEYDEISL
jgi:DNA polymerase III delta subunit